LAVAHLGANGGAPKAVRPCLGAPIQVGRIRIFLVGQPLKIVGKGASDAVGVLGGHHVGSNKITGGEK
jgi:hypothetical protein